MCEREKSERKNQRERKRVTYSFAFSIFLLKPFSHLLILTFTPSLFASLSSSLHSLSFFVTFLLSSPSLFTLFLTFFSFLFSFFPSLHILFSILSDFISIDIKRPNERGGEATETHTKRKERGEKAELLVSDEAEEKNTKKANPPRRGRRRLQGTIYDIRQKGTK